MTKGYSVSMAAACSLVFLAEPAASLTDAQAQVQTVQDIRSVGDAMFNWLVDQVGLAPPGSSHASEADTVDLFHHSSISHNQLESLLVPQYIHAVPELDGWGHPYDYYLDTADPLGLQAMAIRSPGRDGAVSGNFYTAGSFDPGQVDEDIVWADGAFVRWPSIPLSDRGAQTRTVVDIHNVGTAMFSWLTDQVGFASPRPSQAAADFTIHFPDYPEISRADLQGILVPQYMQSVPELDGWGHPYDYRLNVDNPLAPKVMAIRSPGRDGDFSGDSYLFGSFDPDHFDEDIVWADGSLIRWPEQLGGLSFYTVPPCRAFDTRLASALQSGVAGAFHFGGVCGIPMSARAVALNVTVVAPTGAGHVVLFPLGDLAPSTSTIEFAAGKVRSNNAILGLGGLLGSLEAQASVAGGGQVHLILDVSGYFE